MSDRLQLIFLELGRFNKKEDELENWYDKWMYLFKNMARLTSRPETFSEREFDRLFDMAKIRGHGLQLPEYDRLRRGKRRP